MRQERIFHRIAEAQQAIANAKSSTTKAIDVETKYADLDRDYVDIREIDKLGRAAVDTNELFIDNLPVSKDSLIGEEGKGLSYIFHGLNAERECQHGHRKKSAILMNRSESKPDILPQADHVVRATHAHSQGVQLVIYLELLRLNTCRQKV